MSAVGWEEAAGPRSASLSDWTAVFAGIIGAFMAALDISIVNASLPQIQGEIGASGTEGTWIATSYLVAEIIMIPLTAWLVRVFGLQKLLIGCTALFVAFSVVCGVAQSLPAMIAGRVGQGFFGGALIPTAMTIIAMRLPPSQQGQGLAMFGLTVILAPVFGPLLGGWLTDNVSWHWLFFLNVPVGALLILMLLVAIPGEPVRWRILGKADWIGIAGLTLFLGAGTVLLEEGQREGWFESRHIIELAVIVALGSVLVWYSQVTNPEPVVKLSLLKEPSFAGAFVVSLIMGAAFFTVLYIIPVFLGNVAGYSAEQTGVVTMYSGASAFFVIPLIPVLMKYLDIRVIVGCGLALFALSCYMDLDLTAQSGRSELFLSQLVRGVGQALIFMPLSQAAIAGVPQSDAADAAGLFNIARNVGGSCGLALTATLIDLRFTHHQHILREHLAAGGPADSYLDQAAAGFAALGAGPGDAYAMSLGQLALLIDREALVMTYTDCFWVFAIGMLMAVPAVLVLRKPPEGADMMVH